MMVRAFEKGKGKGHFARARLEAQKDNKQAWLINSGASSRLVGDQMFDQMEVLQGLCKGEMAREGWEVSTGVTGGSRHCCEGRRRAQYSRPWNKDLMAEMIKVVLDTSPASSESEVPEKASWSNGPPDAPQEFGYACLEMCDLSLQVINLIVVHALLRGYTRTSEQFAASRHAPVAERASLEAAATAEQEPPTDPVDDGVGWSELKMRDRVVYLQKPSFVRDDVTDKSLDVDKANDGKKTEIRALDTLRESDAVT
ncbi:unnamed protein product [Symbiodinium sp. KB8]|nr:unnamed protein product [Symbiodinium sp. KB8]